MFAMEYYPAIKKNEILKLASKWMELGKRKRKRKTSLVR